jgi:ribonuclease P protein component
MVGRLLRRAEFLRVAATKQKWVAPGLVLQICRRTVDTERPDIDAVRVGFTASRKVGNAVARNRARRRLKAAVAEVFASRRVEPCDLVLVARPGSLDRDYKLLVQDLLDGLKRWKLLGQGATA